MNQFLSEIHEKYTKIVKSTNWIGFLNRLAVSTSFAYFGQNYRTLTDNQPLDILFSAVSMICPSSTFSIVFDQLVAGSFRVSLFIDLGCPRDLGTGWWGAFGTFKISRPI